MENNEFKAFVDKVATMRLLQKEYFKKRDALILKEAKESEREVDAEIKRLTDKQLNLF